MGRLCARLSYPLQWGFILICLITSGLVASQATFTRFFFGGDGFVVVVVCFLEEIVLYLAVDSGCLWGQVSTGSSHITILNWNHLILYLN